VPIRLDPCRRIARSLHHAQSIPAKPQTITLRDWAREIDPTARIYNLLACSQVFLGLKKPRGELPRKRRLTLPFSPRNARKELEPTVLAIMSWACPRDRVGWNQPLLANLPSSHCGISWFVAASADVVLTYRIGATPVRTGHPRICQEQMISRLGSRSWEDAPCGPL
jgi:hypothetical protein